MPGFGGDLLMCVGLSCRGCLSGSLWCGFGIGFSKLLSGFLAGMLPAVLFSHCLVAFLLSVLVGRGGATVLVALALGTSAFSMQDILLEPYGAEILKLTVGQTTALTAFFAAGTLAGFGLAARTLGRNADPYRLAGFGAVAGVFAFSAVIFAAPLNSVLLFRIGTCLLYTSPSPRDRTRSRMPSSA